MSPRSDNVRSAEAKEELESSLHYLISDASSYDKGRFNDIKRSAGTLRTLIYDSKKSTSLLSYLGVKSNIQWLSFIDPKKNEAVNYNHIYFARFRDQRTKAKYYDTCLFYPGEFVPRKLNFNDWWNEKIITFEVDGHPASITREQLIKVEANKDGIDHFDPNINGDIPQRYFSFKRGDTGFEIRESSDPRINYFLLGGDPNIKNKNIVAHDLNLPLTRQIVHEVLLSLLPEFEFNLDYKPDFQTSWLAKLNKIGWHFNVNHKS